MPDADSLLYAAQHAQRTNIALQEAEAAKFSKTKFAITAGRLHGLLNNDHVQWFFAEFVNPLIEVEDRRLHDLKLSDTERTIAAHRYDISVTIRDLIKAKHAEFNAKANAPDTLPTQP